MVENAEPSTPEKATSSSQQTVPSVVSEHDASTSSQAASTAAAKPAVGSEPDTKKLSYAEVCQRLAKDPLVTQTIAASPPASTASQPLQELKVNKVVEAQTSSKHSIDKPKKPGENRPPRQPLRSFRGANGPTRFKSAGLKTRDQQQSANNGKRFSRQWGARYSGKEQNIPPSSLK
ncbi:la-related protein 4-like [Thalassophryne amazonica]|uniref:la-related protein 4-like n=1 Tax=Thalassophryne amazonica TaxID=390379 RepID=UPI001470D630|nr:la-related protein 4-like [Thalassophryne amazonica]